MPPLESKDRTQAVVVWVPDGIDSYGQPTWETPREITVRWVWRQREIGDGKGGTVVLDASVVAGEEVPVDSLLFLGTLEGVGGWYEAGSATDDARLCQVRTSTTTPDIKGRNVRYELGVMRFRARP